MSAAPTFPAVRSFELGSAKEGDIQQPSDADASVPTDAFAPQTLPVTDNPLPSSSTTGFIECHSHRSAASPARVQVPRLFGRKALIASSSEVTDSSLVVFAVRLHVVADRRTIDDCAGNAVECLIGQVDCEIGDGITSGFR